MSLGQTEVWSKLGSERTNPRGLVRTRLKILDHPDQHDSFQTTRKAPVQQTASSNRLQRREKTVIEQKQLAYMMEAYDISQEVFPASSIFIHHFALFSGLCNPGLHFVLRRFFRSFQFPCLSQGENQRVDETEVIVPSNTAFECPAIPF